MGWLVGYTVASIVAAFIAVRIFDYVFAGVVGSLASTARLGVFVIAWTAVTARSGMHGVTTSMRQLRQGIARLR